jgi:hypothetical protein
MRALCVLALLGMLLPAAARAQGNNEFVVERAAQPPRIDGLLDDAVWSFAPLAIPPDGWLSYQPVRGDPMSADFRTEVRVVYDDRSIYFAFHCFDPEPDRLRTTVSKRDNAFSDDWIAISLDSNGTGQTAYHLFSNPSASQMDALNTASSGEQFDADFVWYSAAKTTADGYVVEVQIPLQTLRFSGSDQVRMGLVFFRKISRMGMSYSWPEMLPGQWVFDRPGHLLFDNLRPRRLMELLPSVTYAVNQDRATAKAWNPVLDTANVGLNGKFGITSSVTLDGTVNPDFSQVESDAYQVEVNRRFPVFYSEKRPFFMEGMGLFNVAGTGNGDGNMRTAVHTRRIVDPNWGSKLTGTLDKTTFGVLNSQDDHPEDIGDRGDVFTNRDKLFTIGRATYALGRSNYMGAIFTDTLHASRHNQVIGGDVSVRPSSTQQVSATFLASRTSVDGDDASGNAAQASYGYETRRFQVQTQAEHYDRDFQMDTAFYNRTAFSTVWVFGEVNFYPASKWLQRVHPFVFTKAGHDDLQANNEDLVNTGLRFNVTRQGFFEVAHARGHEAWHGRRYEVGNALFVFGRMQIFRWLEAYAGNGRGPAIYYDDEDPFQGRTVNVFGGFTLQPNQHLSESVELDTVRFDRRSTGARVYDVQIINSKTTYQFDKHFLVRYQAQYDSSEHRFLSDFLASYEFVPGTVFHVGYGSLNERRADANGMLVPVEDGERYLTVNRGLFLKASYLKRF